jgi:hypothetical protein
MVAQRLKASPRPLNGARRAIVAFLDAVAQGRTAML